MNWSYLIKRSWQITWRYKALWVLGLFAGISGCQPSSGGSSGGGTNRFDSAPGSSPFDPSSVPSLDQMILWAVVATGVLFVLGLIWLILGTAARGALVVGVNEIEEGRSWSLGGLWNAGFSRWWGIFGLSLLLGLPVFLVFLVILALIIGPLIASAGIGNGEPGPEVLLPICGSLIVGVPVLLVIVPTLQFLSLVALRYLVLYGLGIGDSVRAAWQVLRRRFKDSILIYLLSGGLNLAASFLLAIPAIFIGVGVAVPLVASIEQGDWRLMVGPIAAGILAITALSLVYNAIWGTYTSALWTLFFRNVLAPPAVPVAAGYPSGYGTEGYPPAHSAPQPPAPPAHSAPQPPTPPAAPEPPAAPPTPPAAPEPPAPPADA